MTDEKSKNIQNLKNTENQESTVNICHVCGRENDADNVFCNWCIAPLNVHKLSEFSEGQLASYVSALMQALASDTSKQDGNVSEDDGELLRSYLSAFWLRPETALLQAAEARIVRKILDKVESEPFLDLGCGNGVNTSLLLGWRFNEPFDVFSDLDLNAADVYDVATKDQKDVSIASAGQKINYGVDIKASMIKRAAALGSFEDARVADATDLPFKDDEISFIYSNLLRDFDGAVLEKVLAECQRILKPGGHLVFSAPTENYQDNLHFFQKAKQYEADGNLELAKENYLLDRGRSTFCSQQVPLQEWHDRLAEYGLDIISSTGYGNRDLLMFWDTGLRPFTHLLVPWLDTLKNSGGREAIKAAAVALEEKLLTPVFAANASAKDCAFQVIVAQKK